MKRLFLLLMFCLPTWVWGQHIDSLQLLLKHENYKEAVSYYEHYFSRNIEDIYKANEFDYILFLNKLGTAYSESRQLEKADSFYHISLDLQEKSKQKSITLLMETYYLRGRNNNRQTAFSEAENCYKKCIELGEKNKIKHNKTYVFSLINKTRYMIKRGELMQSKVNCLSILAILKEEEMLDSLTIYSEALSTLGFFYIEMGENGLAEQVLKNVISYCQPFQDESHLNDKIMSQLSLGGLYKNIGLTEQAFSLFHSILDVYDKGNLVINAPYINATTQIGLLLADKSSKDEALIYAQKALQTLPQIAQESEVIYVNTLNDVGIIYRKIGKYQESETILKEALSIAQKYKRPGYLVTLYTNLALNCANQQKVIEAEKYFEEAEKLTQNQYNKAHPVYAKSLFAQGKMYLQAGMYDKADIYLLESMNNFANYIYTQTPYLTEAEQNQYIQTYNNYLEIFHEYIEKRRQDKPQILENYANQLLITKSFMLENQMKNQKNIVESKDTSMVNLYQNWLFQKRQLAKLTFLPPEKVKAKENEINKLTANIEEMEKGIARYNLSIHVPKPYTWKDVKNALSEKEVVIELIRFYPSTLNIPTDSLHYAALLITPNCTLPKYIPLPNGKALESTFLANYQQAIENNTNTNEAYEAFWLPIEKEIGQAKTVYFAADGVYHNINLALLQDEKGKFLLEKYELHQVFSTREVAEKRENTNNQTIALLGNPTFDLDKAKWLQQSQNMPVLAYTLRSGNGGKPVSRQGFEPLLYAEKEVKEIADLCRKQKWQTAIYTQNTATEDILYQLQSPNILHIATHGYVEAAPTGENPMLHAGLYFAGAKTFVEDTTNEAYIHEDGILSAYEAATLPLEHTDLVVLSACETALGAVRNGEGVYGLQRGFKIAGAKSILMTLWQVPDAPTEAFMKDFYQSLLAGKSPQKALKLAQIHAMKQKVPVKYWGAFVLVGQ